MTVGSSAYCTSTPLRPATCKKREQESKGEEWSRGEYQESLKEVGGIVEKLVGLSEGGVERVHKENKDKYREHEKET